MLIYLSVLTLIATNVLMIGAYLAMRAKAKMLSDELCEMRLEAQHQSMHMQARKLLIAEMVDARTRRN